jgi:hypothetical protein
MKAEYERCYSSFQHHRCLPPLWNGFLAIDLVQ